ncbi:MAG: hypothetical protein ACLFSO_03965 [Halanaerobium sp.]
MASSRDNLLFNEIKTGGTAISIALTKGRFFAFLEEKYLFRQKLTGTRYVHKTKI